jgi:TPR repeat protein
MYQNGHGLERDLVQAYAWYGVAAAGGDAMAVRLRDHLQGRLSAPDLERARALARELYQTHGSDPAMGG